MKLHGQIDSIYFIEIQIHGYRQARNARTHARTPKKKIDSYKGKEDRLQRKG